MPTYDLSCKKCGHRFERFVPRLIRDTDKVCPRCGSTEVVTGVGGGFVKTSSGTAAGSCVSSGGFG
ncbi:MAG: zinc ribbon domain-containing protein [Actinomycetia bacterium]|nr:zinc ribbon domain-containing protein [Actinomycetes bacterium]